jgi:signal peptidase II
MQVATLLLSAASAVFALDQLMKAWLLSSLPRDEAIGLGSLQLRGVRNQRACAGFLRDKVAMTAVWAGELLLFLFLVQFSPLFQGVAAPAALGISLGGAGSNLLDRLVRDCVIDYIAVGPWPVFNLADVAIVIGALIALIYM